MLVTRRVFAAASIRMVALIGATCVLVAVAGCWGRTSNAERITQARKETHLSSVTLYPLAGRVTVDNQTLSMKSKREVLVVVAYDASKPDASAAEQPYVRANEDGSFEFTDGGLPAGKYVMLFAELDRKTKKPRLGDGLKNLYNDPDVNQKKPEFVVDHQEPGKIDYLFNLNVAGETPPPHAGPKAFTRLPR